MERNYLGSVSASTASSKLGDENVSNDSTASNILFSEKKIPQRIEDASLLKNVDSPKDFIDAITPHAKKAAQSMGVDYRVLIAQSALETGWGKHVIRDPQGNQSFNLFNIKADQRWEGKSVSVPTIEYVDGIAQREKANFRRYASIDESF